MVLTWVKRRERTAWAWTGVRGWSSGADAGQLMFLKPQRMASP